MISETNHYTGLVHKWDGWLQRRRSINLPPVEGCLVMVTLVDLSCHPSHWAMSPRTYYHKSIVVIGKTSSVWSRGGLPPWVTPLGMDENLPIILRLGSMLTCNTHSAVPGRVKKCSLPHLPCALLFPLEGFVHFACFQLMNDCSVPVSFVWRLPKMGEKNHIHRESLVTLDEFDQWREERDCMKNLNSPIWDALG